jgi:hypothetical protein
MKKIILLLVLGASVFSASVAAQGTTRKYKESEYYYYNIPIEKIYSYRLGYMIVYRKGVNQMARTYIPADWFTTIGGKGELVTLGSGKEWPSMSVYYKSGEFHHVRLRVRRERLHETWAVVPLNINIDEYFKDIEEVKLEF